MKFRPAEKKKQTVVPIVVGVGDIIVISAEEYIVVAIRENRSVSFRVMSVKTCNVLEEEFESLESLSRYYDITNVSPVYKANTVYIGIEE